jgi:predicted nucleic acid-binding protein
MPEVISNTSPLLYLYRIGALEWLPTLCRDIWIPQAVVREFQEGQRKGYDVPMPRAYTWLQVVEPRAVPSDVKLSMHYHVRQTLWSLDSPLEKTSSHLVMNTDALPDGQRMA